MYIRVCTQVLRARVDVSKTVRTRVAARTNRSTSIDFFFQLLRFPAPTYIRAVRIRTRVYVYTEMPPRARTY